jgi:hypothetical protein
VKTYVEISFASRAPFQALPWDGVRGCCSGGRRRSVNSRSMGSRLRRGNHSGTAPSIGLDRAETGRDQSLMRVASKRLLNSSGRPLSRTGRSALLLDT